MINKSALINPSLVKENKEVIKDIAYLKANIKYLNLSFQEYPKELTSNIYFIFEYFSNIKTNPKEYKYIPDFLLKEPFFVASCLKNNPDIYLLADKECQTNFAFQTILENFPESFLKYAKEEDINDIEYCKNALKISELNYKFLPEKVRADIEICKQVIKNDGCIELVAKNLPTFCKENKEFIQNLINCEIDIFEFIPKNYKNDFYLCAKVIKKDPSKFKFISDELKANKEFINTILSYGFNNYRTYEENIEKIIVNLPNVFFTKDFTEKHKLLIKKIFTELPKENRSNLTTIKAIYKANIIEENCELYKSRFLNKITDLEFAKEFKFFLKSFEKKYYNTNLKTKIITFIENYELNKELNGSLLNKNENKNVIKSQLKI